MKNLKLINFITKYDALYSSFSIEEKEMISDLDYYNLDLKIYSTGQGEIYIYVGKKDNLFYILKYSWPVSLRNRIKDSIKTKHELFTIEQSELKPINRILDNII